MFCVHHENCYDILNFKQSMTLKLSCFFYDCVVLMLMLKPKKHCVLWLKDNVANLPCNEAHVM